MSTLAGAVFWTGTGLEVLGLAVGAAGFRRTWRELSTGDRLFGREVDWIKHAARAAGRFVRRILRREPPTKAVRFTRARGMIGGFGTARSVAHAGLPSLADDPEGFAAEVEARLRTLHRQAHAIQGQMESEAKARKAADRQLADDLQAKVATVEDLSRRVAVDGLRAQIVGWSCIVLGFALQSAATPFM